MNPFETPSRTDSKAPHPHATRYFVAAAASALTGLVVASPGVVYLLMNLNRREMSSRRYATYDPELGLFGISITPTTAQLLALGVAPVLMSLSVFLVFRGLRSKIAKPTRAPR